MTNKEILELNLKAQVDYVNKLHREVARLNYQFALSFWFGYDTTVQTFENDYKKQIDEKNEELSRAINRMKVMRQEYLNVLVDLGSAGTSVSDS